MNGRLTRWVRGLGAAILVIAVLPLSAGPALADNSGSSGRGSDKAAERCLEKDNGRGNDCPAPEAASPASTTEASAPAPEGKAQEQTPSLSAPAASSQSAAAAPATAAPARAAGPKTKDSEVEKVEKGKSSSNGRAESKHTPAAPAAAAAKPPTASDKKPDSPKKGGHTPVNVCHATSSDSNPYVFLTVDDDSVKAEGHLAHRNEPNKTWKSSGTYLGSPHLAGDAKPDLIGSYTNADGVFVLGDGAINSLADCHGPIPPPPPPPPPFVAATGSFSTVCTATAAIANVGAMTTGSATPGSFRLVGTNFSVPVISNQTNVAVPANTVLRLEYAPTSGNVQVLQTLRSEKACPAVTPPTSGELTKTSVPPSGSVVTAGQTIDYTVTVVNTGQVAIRNAPVVDTLPDRVTVVAGTVSDKGVVSANGRTITWTANLAPGASKTYTYQGRVDATAPAGTSLVNKVTFLLMERTTTHPVGDRSLEVRKAVSAAVVKFGDPLTYTLTVRALGTLGQTEVVVRDGIPAGTTYVSGSAACDASPCMESFANNEVTWTLGAMEPGATRTVTFRVTVDRPRATVETGIPAVTIRNVGLAFSTEVPPTPSNEVVTDVVAVGGVKTGPNGPGGSDGPGGGSGGGPNPDDDVSVSPTSGGPLAQTGGGLPFGAVLLFGGLLLLAGIALLRLGWSTRGTPGALG